MMELICENPWKRSHDRLEDVTSDNDGQVGTSTELRIMKKIIARREWKNFRLGQGFGPVVISKNDISLMSFFHMTT
jgi:hypothetical protein